MNEIDQRFVHRLSQIDNDLLDPIADRSSLAGFNGQWVTLVDDLNAAIEADILSTSTISMAHALAHRVSKITQTFLDLDTLSEQLMSSLLLETSSIIETSSKPSIFNSSSSSRAPSPPTETLLGRSSPSYITSSYQWMLNNLHNPYPSVNIRDCIAKETGSARKDIDSWFIDARKRIGWNALRKEHFSNKRSEIVDAATRFFISNDPKRPLNPDVELEFAAIEIRAQDLYAEKLSESSLSLKLNMIVKDLTPEMKHQAKAEKHRRKLLEKNAVASAQNLKAICSYPSPCRSPGHSPTPSLFFDLDDESSHTTASTRRKRYISSVDSSDNSRTSCSKRSRLESPSSESGTFSVGLPSPALSINEPLQPFEECGTEGLPLLLNPPSLPLAPNRKRRLSDTDKQDAPKRPRNQFNYRRPYAVSDPMPSSGAIHNVSDFDNWFHEHFNTFIETPSNELDVASPLDIELYDFSKSNDIIQLPSLTDSIQYPSPTIQDQTVLSSPAESQEIQSFTLDISTNDFNYDELFWPDEIHEFGGQDITQFDEIPLLPYGLSSIGIDFQTNRCNSHDTVAHLTDESDNAQIADTSLPISINPASNLDWTFASPISLSSFDIHSVDLEGYKSQELGSFNSLLDYSSMGLPLPTHGISPGQLLSQAERAAKQMKLLEIMETARRLEEELATS